MGDIIKIGGLSLDLDNIIGYALINNLPNTPYYRNVFRLPDGLYPIIYFEECSVQIAVDVGDPDFMWIKRSDFEWIKI